MSFWAHSMMLRITVEVHNAYYFLADVLMCNWPAAVSWYIVEISSLHVRSSHARRCCAPRRYKKPADWRLISQVAADHQVPVVGNGDILTYYEAQQRQRDHRCHAMMVGRGALIKPWIFQEYKEVGRQGPPDP